MTPQAMSERLSFAREDWKRAQCRRPRGSMMSGFGFAAFGGDAFLGTQAARALTSLLSFPDSISSANAPNVTVREDLTAAARLQRRSLRRWRSCAHSERR